MSVTVCEASMPISATVSGRGPRGWVQISTPIYFNTPFSSCFTRDCHIIIVVLTTHT